MIGNGPTILNAPTIYNTGAGGVYAGRGVYKGDFIYKFVTIGGKKYRAVLIGNIFWLDENLDYKDNNIGYNTSDSLTSPRCCYYNNQSQPPFSGYGLLYNYPATKYINQNILTDGWRVANSNDFVNLCLFAGGVEDTPSGSMIKGFLNCGTSLKSTSNWVQGNDYGNGTNEFGFNAFPSGRKFGGNFSGIGEHFNSWLIDTVDSENSCRTDIYYDAPNFAYYKTKNDRMASIRICIDA